MLHAISPSTVIAWAPGEDWYGPLGPLDHELRHYSSENAARPGIVERYYRGRQRAGDGDGPRNPRGFRRRVSRDEVAFSGRAVRLWRTLCTRLGRVRRQMRRYTAR